MKRLKGKSKALKGRTLKPKNPKTLIKLAIAIVITVFAALLYIKIAPHTYDAKQRVKLQKTIQELQTTQKSLSQQQVKDVETQKKLEETNKQLQDTQKQLEAKRNTAVAYAAAAPVVTPVVPKLPTVVAGCGDNEYAHYIYMHESGCNTSALNSIGCYGIGQSCPASKIAHCGADYACQNAWFTAYAAKYGGWAGAYQFWLSHHWW